MLDLLIFLILVAVFLPAISPDSFLSASSIQRSIPLFEESRTWSEMMRVIGAQDDMDTSRLAWFLILSILTFLSAFIVKSLGNTSIPRKTWQMGQSNNESLCHWQAYL